LTYFTELEDDRCNEFFEKALDTIANDNSKKDKDQIISPIIILEILQKKPKLKFKVIKKYLSEKLDFQDRMILKNRKMIKDNL